MLHQSGTRLSQFFSVLGGFLLEPYPGSVPRWLSWGWIAGVYLVGIFLWGQVLNWGHIPFDWQDWAEISGPRIAFMRNAVLTGQLPLHMQDASALRNITDRYLELPDVITAPQMFLLRWLNESQYVLVSTWFLYSLGILGLLWFWRKYRLSPVAFAALALLFSVNGQIVSHFSVGHANYGGYFLFPWLVALVIVLLERPSGRKPGWGWVAGVAFLLFFILLQGSFHQFIWGLMFLGLVGIFSMENLGPVLKALVFAGLLSAVRLLPPVLGLGRFDNEFLGGYPSLLEVWNSLVTIRLPADALNYRNFLSPLAWWEVDLYVGLTGTVLLIVFGLVLWIRRRMEPDGYPALFLPVVVMFILSIGRIYRAVQILPVPFLNGERVSSRLIVIPFVVVLLLAAIYFQRWADQHARSTLARWGLALLLLPMANDLWQNAKAWRVNIAAQSFPFTEVNLTLKVVKNYPDPVYTNLVIAGAVLSLLTALFLLLMAWLEKRRQNFTKIA